MLENYLLIKIMCLFFQLAPENTEMSFLKTIEHGGDGLETDVAIR